MDSDKFKAQQQKIQGALVAVNRTVNGLAAEDLTFLRTIDPDVATEIDVQAARLLRLSNSLIKSAAGATGRNDVPVLNDTDEVETNWPGVGYVIDALLEKVDTILDEYTGHKRKDAPTTGGGSDPKKARSGESSDMEKPQEKFERLPDNSDTGPWKPLLSEKPHATYVSLEDSLVTFVDESKRTQYRHPYETEITRLQYPAEIYSYADPVRFTPLEDSAAVWVDTFEGVEAMLAELKSADVIAVDLEHHDFRTYTGLLSLMQISTRTKDWVIDTLQPWRHKLEILNEVFADPSKIKVFHGARSDIIWLQRDLGLYVVGLFDTYYACECLEYPERSLASLLKNIADIAADKQYQMADWRKRPLTAEMLKYARSDTHYLLYIYDRIRNELAEKSSTGASLAADKNLTEFVLRKSKEVSLLCYEAPCYDVETGEGPRGWLKMFEPRNRKPMMPPLSGEQFAVFRAIYAWRDATARRLDESTGYIMSNGVLSNIARLMPLDQFMLGGLSRKIHVPDAKTELGELFALIKDAKQRGAEGPTSVEFMNTDKIKALTKATVYRHGGFGGDGGSTGGNTISAAATTSKVASKDTTPLPDIADLRSNFSQLWGPSALSVGKIRGGKAEHGGAQVKAPWYVQAAIAGRAPVDAEEVVDEAAVAATPSAKSKTWDDYDYIEVSSAQKPVQAEVEAEVQHDQTQETKETGETEEAKEPAGAFTLKWGAKDVPAKDGKKTKGDRKAAKQAAATATTADTASRAQTSDSDGGASLHDVDGDEQGDDYVPFNYDTAGSVLHAKPDKSQQDSKKRKGKKVFNPYGGNADGKGDDGPKPARRMHFEKMGKGGTFKK